MSRAFVNEGHSTTSGSLVDRFYRGLLGLSDPAKALYPGVSATSWGSSWLELAANGRSIATIAPRH
jgi:hypothetical protein